MKYSFDLTHYRRANVWLDEAPPIESTASYSVTRILKPSTSVAATRRIAALEIKVPRDASSYAFLGAELAMLALGGLEVVVPVSETGPRYASPLSGRDEVRVGLPEEYVEGVLAGVEKAGNAIGLPTGASLQFQWAAHAEVGSSRLMFETASDLILRLLLSPREDSEKEIAALFG